MKATDIPAGTTVSAIGQDSHRFVTDSGHVQDSNRKLILAGIVLEGEPALAGNSDADVVLHALTNAISGVTTRNILGARADQLCLKEGIRDSAVYLQLALDDLAAAGWQLAHVSLSLEAARPHLSGYLDAMRARLAELTGLASGCIGITATSGEGLTAFGRGEGIQAFCMVTVRKMRDQHLALDGSARATG